MRALVAALLCGLALAGVARAQDLTVTKVGGAPLVLSAETLKDLPRQRVTVAGAAGPDLYEGPSLTHVMREAKIPVGARAHGAPMRGYLVVRGADGYAVVLSAVEADKELHDDVVILADTLNGQPLPEREGPWRLVVDDDSRSWRSVRNVVDMDYRLAD